MTTIQKFYHFLDEDFPKLPLVSALFYQWPLVPLFDLHKIYVAWDEIDF